MPNIFHQSTEDILKAATPEQKILWNYIFLQYGERVSISQYNIHNYGSLTGVFTARQLFVIYDMTVAQVVSTGTVAAMPYCMLYDDANSVKGVYTSAIPYWDATAAAVRYTVLPLNFNNIIISRILISNYHTTKIIGYRIVY